MIRINLLPQRPRQQERGEGGQLWLVFVLALLAVEVLGAFLLYSSKQDELEARKTDNALLRDRIQQAKDAAKNHAEIKSKLAVLRAREEAIEKLQRARLGPAAMMLELSRLLTKNQGPTINADRLKEIQRKNPLSTYDQSWDARRVWLSSFNEEQRTVRLEGLARDGEDVSELARRMNLSAYFYDIKLLPAKREKEDDSGIEWVKFQLEAKVRY